MLWTVPKADRAVLVRYARGLLIFTLLYNIAEGCIAIGSGIVAGSVALVGFGLDSFIEVCAAGILLWSFGRLISGEEAHQGTGRKLEAAIGVTFFVLAAYVLAEALFILIGGSEPGESL